MLVKEPQNYVNFSANFWQFKTKTTVKKSLFFTSTILEIRSLHPVVR